MNIIKQKYNKHSTKLKQKRAGAKATMISSKLTQTLKLYGISMSQSMIKKYVMTADVAQQIGKLPIQIKPEITVKKHILHFTIYKTHL